MSTQNTPLLSEKLLFALEFASIAHRTQLRKGNQEFVDKFNTAVRAKHTEAHQTAAPDAMGSGEEPAAEVPGQAK